MRQNTVEWVEGKGWKVEGDEWKVLFCFCGQYTCGNKEMFKVNTEVVSVLNQYFVRPSVPLVYHSSAPVLTYLILHNFAKCIVLLKHLRTCLISWYFYPECSVMGQRDFYVFFWDNIISFKDTSYLFLYFSPLLMASCICWCGKHVTAALSTHCYRMLLLL
jgi:hypothetical protein